MSLANFHSIKRRQSAYDRLPLSIRIALSNATMKYDDAEIEQMLLRGVSEAQILFSIFANDADVRERRRREIEAWRKEKRRGFST